MESHHHLRFRKISKLDIETRYEGVYIYQNNITLDPDMIKVLVLQDSEQNELIYDLCLNDGMASIQLRNSTKLLEHLLEEAFQFAQSILAFHQDKDSYTMSLLNESV